MSILGGQRSKDTPQTTLFLSIKEQGTEKNKLVTKQVYYSVRVKARNVPSDSEF